MRAVDTNVLVRLVTRDNERQFAAASAFIQTGVWVSQVVMVEAVWVLDRAYGFSHDEIYHFVEMLLNHASISVENADVIAAAVAQYRMQPSLRFTDCVILELARSAGHLPLGTFDKNLGKLANAQRLQ